MDQHELIVALALALAGYVIGSVPFGLLVGRWFYGIDVRTFGSGNIGTANAYRTLGPLAGALVMACDIAKGFVPALIAAQVLPPWLTVLVAVTPVVGHMRSIFLGFTGGKGVATGAGVVLALMWPIFAIILVLWLTVIVVTRYVSLASICAAAGFALLTFVFAEPTAYRVFAVVVSATVIWAHRANMGRLARGTESRIPPPWRSRSRRSSLEDDRGAKPSHGR
jgi:acyl phosphate:glycerol-3-phosphate acyltransferase